MKIAEKYAKYTDKELAKVVETLIKKIYEDYENREYFKNKDDEKFQTANKQFNDDFELYLDIKCAYQNRIRNR